jgi:hypothetical protein
MLGFRGIESCPQLVAKMPENLPGRKSATTIMKKIMYQVVVAG